MYRRNCLVSGLSIDNLDLSILAKNHHPGALELLDRTLKEAPNTAYSIIYDICIGLLYNSHHNAIPMLIRIIDSHGVMLWDDTQVNSSLWFGLSRHTDPLAIEILSAYPNNIRTAALSANPSSAAADLLRRYPDKINWGVLARNPGKCAIALMADYPDRVSWRDLALNSAPEAIALMEAHPDRVDWISLVYNSSPAAVSLLLDNIRYIQSVGEPDALHYLSNNPHIFEEKYDYAAMRVAMDVHREELAKAAFHSRRLKSHLEAGGDPDSF
jgi:hypothetical protein